MFDLPVIKLPYELTELLKMKLYNNAESYSKILALISSNKAMSAIVVNAFREFSEEGKISAVLNTLGWKHFRDRLVSVYVYKKLFNRYPDTTDIHIITELTDFEESFASFSIESNSRSLLLSFYLKLLELDQRQDGASFRFSTQFDEVRELIELKAGKTQQIDWLIFISWHLVSYFGFDKLEEEINTGVDFDQLIDLLTISQKRQFINNSLSYGCSIGDKDNFYCEQI
jgi:hypothetical protein